MGNLTENRPKCLVKLHGKSLLDWQLEAIRKAGIHEIAIVTGYQQQMLANRVPTEFYNPRWAETNMVSSLECAEDWLREKSCIVSYSDIFYHSQAVSLLLDCAGSIAVTFDPNWLALWEKRFGDPLLDAESFRLNPDSTLAEIGSKPQTVDEVQGQYMGLLRFTPEGWKEVKRIRNSLGSLESDRMHMTSTLQKIIEAGNVAVTAVPYAKPWGEVDSIEDLNQYQ